MNEKDKELLLKDLCGRFPYGLYIRVEDLTVPEKNDDRITEGFIGNYLNDNRCNEYDVEGILNELADGCINVKPYLRPMSSMTDEEMRVLDSMCDGVEMVSRLYGLKMFDEAFDWLNVHHFDYRGLIDKRLALEANEGMYKNE